MINLPKLFSQNDPNWKYDKHGTSNSTIGATGCTISVITMMLRHAGYDVNPKIVDDLLTANGGYADGNLILWPVVSKIWPKVKFIYRYQTYNDVKAKEWIAKGMMPIVQVGSLPIGGSPNGRHWVGALGDKKSVDPWPYPAQIKTFDTWDPTGLALYEYTPSEIISTGGTPMADLPSNYGDMVKKSGYYDQVIKEILGITDRDPKDVGPNEVQDLITQLKNQINGKDEEYKKIKAVVFEQDTTIDNQSKLITTQSDEIKDLKKKLETALSNPPTTTDGTKKVSLYEVGIKLLEQMKDVTIEV